MHPPGVCASPFGIGREPAPGPLEKQIRVSQRDVGERRQLLMLQCETQTPGVKRHGARDVLHLIPNSVDRFDETGCICRGVCCSMVSGLLFLPGERRQVVEPERAHRQSHIDNVRGITLRLDLVIVNDSRKPIIDRNVDLRAQLSKPLCPPGASPQSIKAPGQLMKRTRLAVVIASVVALATAARAQVGGAQSAPTTLTLEQALQYALDHYPSVRAALER